MKLRITSGNPTTEEVAAIAASVLGLASGAAPPPVRRTPAWARAARFEALGQAPFNSSADARLPHRPTGALPPAAERPAAS